MPDRSRIKDLTSRRDGARSVYLLPGVAGHPLHFRPLAKLLQHKWHIRALLYPPHFNGDISCASIDDLASRMLPAFDEIREDPVIMGYSLGGSLGFAMAAKLADQGARPTVVMIDSGLRALRGKPRLNLTEKLIRRVNSGYRRLFRQWPGQVLRSLQRSIGSPTPAKAIPVAMAGQQTADDPDYVRPPAWIKPGDPLLEFHRDCIRAVRAYHPAPAPVRIVMIRAVPDNRPAVLRRIYWPLKERGWHLVGNVIGIVPCRGSHVSIIKPDNRAALASAVDQALDIAFGPDKA